MGGTAKSTTVPATSLAALRRPMSVLSVKPATSTSKAATALR